MLVCCFFLLLDLADVSSDDNSDEESQPVNDDGRSNHQIQNCLPEDD